MKPKLFILDGIQVEIPERYVPLIKSKYRKEIAAEYGLNTSVFRRRCTKKGLDIGLRGYMDEVLVLRIYLAMGWPIRIDV
jgi:hypothetical protein